MEYCWLRLLVIMKWLHPFLPFHHPTQLAAFIYWSDIFPGESGRSSALTDTVYF